MTQKIVGSKRQLTTLLLIVFFGFLGISMPYLIFPALFLNPEYSILPANSELLSQALLLGTTLAVYPLGQFFGSPILGGLSDDYGRKWLLVGSLLMAACCNLLTGLALHWHWLWLVITSRFFAGLMEGNISIARAMAADIKSISKHETFGKINAVASVAFLVGPIMGGLLADNKIFAGATSATPFYVMSVLFFSLSLASVFLFIDSSAREFKDEKVSIWSRINLFNRLFNLFKDKQLKSLLIVSSFFALAIDVFYEFAPVYLTAKWMFGPADLILYNSLLCVALAVGNGWLAPFSSTRFLARRGIIVSAGGFALLLLGIVLTNQTLMMMGLFTLCGLVIGLGWTLITVKISDAVPDTIQGEMMGVQMSLRFLGDALICILGGLLLLVSPKLILFLAACISAATMIYYIFHKD